MCSVLHYDTLCYILYIIHYLHVYACVHVFVQVCHMICTLHIWYAPHKCHKSSVQCTDVLRSSLMECSIGASTRQSAILEVGRKGTLRWKDSCNNLPHTHTQSDIFQWIIPSFQMRTTLIKHLQNKQLHQVQHRPCIIKSCSPASQRHWMNVFSRSCGSRHSLLPQDQACWIPLVFLRRDKLIYIYIYVYIIYIYICVCVCIILYMNIYIYTYIYAYIYIYTWIDWSAHIADHNKIFQAHLKNR